MTKEEFQQLVVYAGAPKEITEDFERWQHRAFVALFLRRQRFQDIHVILELLYSAVDGEVEVEVDDEGNEEECDSELFLKELVFRALAECIWQVENDADKAIHYIDLGIALAKKRCEEQRGSDIPQGEFWYYRWQILSESTRLAQALAETEKIIATEDTDLQNNSLLYYAYRFQAETVKADNIEQALVYLYKALRYFPDEHNELPKREELWEQRQSAPEKTYEELEKLTHHEVVWER